ncbi:MAG: TonB-dependent receptor plug domain-containing protein [Ferruginibacter sp.]|nr:TonB-dependent receptor plug domain-containing protein [Ferruginibacter sp.]
MRKIILITLFATISFIYSVAQAPELTINGKTNEGVYLESLKIDISVCGSIATTNWQMTFKNTTNRILEGNLNFPLKEGLSVSRYALDINGKMREAVPVDRAKGTATFEAIERRRVDPGLLEKLDGNVFRTRIYPIPANGSRTVIIGYNEELPKEVSSMIQYKLPLNLKDTVNDFSLNISVIQSLTQPIFNLSTNENISFDKQQNNYKAIFTKKNYVPNFSLSFDIPKAADVAEVMLQPFEGKYCFLINTTIQKSEVEKIMPKTIALIWDESLSGAGRNINKEIAILDAYFKKVNNATILFQRFNNKASAIKKHLVQNGQWSSLKKDIDSLVYDGGTNFGNLNFKNIVADEFILVSDGHQTIGNGTMQYKNTPIYCINSSTTADYSFLHYLTLKTGGQLIDLVKDDSISAIKKLTTESYCFLGIKNRNGIEENYPSLSVPVVQNFSVAGIMEDDIEEITLQFGYGNKVTYEKSIRINAEDDLCKDFDITKIYAQKKIVELDINYEKNKTVIENIGKQFGIVTRNTSLIVLETLNDYLQYQIQPPAEFREEYQRIIKQRVGDVVSKDNDNFNTSLKIIEGLKKWYNPLPKVAVKLPKKTPQNEIQQSSNVAALRPTPNQSSNNNRNITVSGVVRNASGDPVPFATVAEAGTNNKTQADAGGLFSLRVKSTTQQITISSAGYDPITVEAGENRTYALQQASKTVLSEVVVSSGFVKRQSREVGTATTVVTVKELNQASVVNAATGLAGKVAGLNIQTVDNGVNPQVRVTLRGNRSILGNNQALIVVDGIIVDNAYLARLNPSDIDNVTILKGAGASAIYGSDASNGVFVVSTKNNSSNSITVMQSKLDSVIKSGENVYDINIIDYIKELKKSSKEKRYDKYIEMRDFFIHKPTYFFDVAGYFLKIGEKEIGLKILSNLAEMENANYELYKMLGYKLKEAGDYDAEVSAFKKVLELRPLEPQSYRDYALALEDIGQYQKALDILYEGLNKSYSEEMSEMYEGIEEIFLVEINRLIHSQKKQINTKSIKKELITDLSCDVRIVLNWNKNNTDIDLWVTDPNGEKCFYQNKSTAIGGRISDDFTEGFGPEQFILKKGVKGKYKIQMDYYSDAQVTIAGPTTIMAEIYLYYGTPKEERKIITMQMKKDTEDEVYIGEIVL